MEPGTPTEYAIVSEYISAPRGNALARKTITGNRAQIPRIKGGSAQWKGISPILAGSRFPRDRPGTFEGPRRPDACFAFSCASNLVHFWEFPLGESAPWFFYFLHCRNVLGRPNIIFRLV